MMTDDLVRHINQQMHSINLSASELFFLILAHLYKNVNNTGTKC
jgi:hypothetical protein